MPKKLTSVRVKAKYKPDHKAFTEFATSDQMLEPLYTAAHAIRTIAQADAAKKTGAYAAGFKVDAGAGNLRIGRFNRRITVVLNSDPAAVPEEFGGKRNAANHTLARAGAAVGEFRGELDDD